MPPYALVIFDFDGTLADSWPMMGQAMIEAADRFGYRRLTPEDMQDLRGQDNRAVMQALGVTMWQLPRIAVHMRQVAREQADRIGLFPGVPELLHGLAGAGVRTAIVSSNGEDVVRRVLGADLSRLVDDFACGAAIFGKATKFRTVVRRAGLGPAQAIGVGDEARDIDAARAAGIAAGAVTWGYATPDLLRSRAPSHVFRTMEDMTGTLTGG